MSSTDLIIFGMCAGMILIGVVVIRLSHRDRGIGAIAVALGVIGVIAYLGAEDGAPPRSAATPGSTLVGSPVDASSTPGSTLVGAPADAFATPSKPAT